MKIFHLQVNPPFQPTIESTTVAEDEVKFLTECPYAKYLSDQFSKMSYITGFTSNETLLFAGSKNLEEIVINNLILIYFESIESL